MRECHEGSRKEFEQMAEEIMDMSSRAEGLGEAARQSVLQAIMEYLSIAFDMGGNYWHD